MSVHKRKRKKSLAHGRSVVAKKPPSTLSSKVTKTVINRHHQLHKRLAKAARDGDEAETFRLQDELSQSGGLEKYQSASITGQSLTRGGDSSAVLVAWLKSRLGLERLAKLNLRILEVGALSIGNAISKVSGVQMSRIDLNSQHPQIQKQDFMTMPPPQEQADRFDVVSLSLVVNYVPDAEGRGEMLKRVSSFLRPSKQESAGENDMAAPDVLPAMFLVLPASCITNSRYLTERRLGEIMGQLGYEVAERKLSAKLIYQLWHYRGTGLNDPRLGKEKVNDGKNRNNFCILLR